MTTCAMCGLGNRLNTYCSECVAHKVEAAHADGYREGRQVMNNIPRPLARETRNQGDRFRLEDGTILVLVREEELARLREALLDDKPRKGAR